MLHRWSGVAASASSRIAHASAQHASVCHTARSFSTLLRPHARPPHAASSSLLSTCSSSSASSCRAATPFARSISTSRVVQGLEEFFVNQQAGSTGRSWSVEDIRRKSFEDIQKLWFVLLKERNMLYTYKHQCRYLGETMENPERIRKVRHSMKAIKIVLGERHQAYKAATDPQWVAYRADVQSRRRVGLARRKARTGLPSHRRPPPGGVAIFRQTKSQKFASLRARPEGVAPPQGEFPTAMTAARVGHGQTAEALTRKRVKKDKEYF